MIHVNGKGFCDDQIPVLSTIGRGPKGSEGAKGDKGDKGDNGDLTFPTYANPIEWSRNNEYDELTIVFSGNNAYMSKTHVPRNIDVHDQSYWQVINDYQTPFNTMNNAANAANDAANNANNTSNAVRAITSAAISTMVSGYNSIADEASDAIENISDATSRAEAAIDAIGDISTLAVPLMSTDVRGGAKLDEDDWSISTPDGNLKFSMSYHSRRNLFMGGITYFDFRGSIKQARSTGKNLIHFKEANEYGVHVGIDPTYGYLTVSGTPTSSLIYVTISEMFELENNTIYHISCGNTQDRIRMQDGIRVILNTRRSDDSIYQFNEVTDGLTFSAYSAYKYDVVMQIDFDEIDIDDILPIELQLEIGSRATEWEPYTGGQLSPSVSLRRVPEMTVGHVDSNGRYVTIQQKYRDGSQPADGIKLYLPNIMSWMGPFDEAQTNFIGDVSWILRTKKVYLNGEEDWFGESSPVSGSSFFIYVNSTSKISDWDLSNSQFFSDAFVRCTSWNEFQQTANGMYLDTDLQILHFNVMEEYTLEEWKSLLRTNPIEIIYPSSNVRAMGYGNVDFRHIFPNTGLFSEDVDMRVKSYVKDDYLLDIVRTMYYSLSGRIDALENS